MNHTCTLKLLLILTVLITSIPLQVASAKSDRDLQSWNIITFEAPKDKKLRGYIEIQPRLSDNITELDQLLIRPALYYEPKKGIILGQGYAWTPGFNPEYKDEHRLWQHLSLTKTFKNNWTLTNRARLEERFIEDAGSTNLRLRYQLRAQHPFGKTKKWYIAGYDEVFFNLTSSANGPENGFNQNRVFLGIGKILTKQVQLESGYLMQHINRPSPGDDSINHVIVLWLKTVF